MYVISRSDLSTGNQATQAIHAAFQFAVTHPEVTREWYVDSNYLVFLSVPDEEALQHIADRLSAAGRQFVVTQEPDFEGCPITAIVVAPHPENRRILSNLPLALREPAMV